jgi:hypothetical protein
MEGNGSNHKPNFQAIGGGEDAGVECERGAASKHPDKNSARSRKITPENQSGRNTI